MTLISCQLFAQKATVSGQINIKNSHQSIADVYIYIEGTSFYDISDASGNFQITDIPFGNYELVSSNIGFSETRTRITLNSEVYTKLTIGLTEEINNLPTIQISSQTGTGGLLGALDLAGSAHYISKKELNSFNSSNVNDILQSIPGVQLQEEDGFGLRPNIGLRGTGSERSSKITIMEDGILSAPAPYSAPSAYYFPTVARMDAIEIMKGASQIKYGPFTTGGVINFISSTIPKQFQGNLNLGFGNFGSRQIKANLGDKLGNFSYVVQGMQIQSDGFKKISGQNNNTGFDKKDWLAKLKWQSSENAKIFQSIQFKYAETREQSNETYLGISRVDFESDPYQRYAASQMDEMNTEHRQLSLNYLLNPIKNFYIQATAYQNNFFRNWYKLDKVQNDQGNKTSISKLLSKPINYSEEFSLINGRSSINNEELHVKANNRNYVTRGLQTKFNYLLNDHSFEFGIRAHYDEMDRFQWVDEYRMNSNIMELISSGLPGSESNRIESALAIATYGKYKLSYQKIVFDLGIRNENIMLSRLDYGKEDSERLGTKINERVNHVNVLIPGASIKYNVSDTKQIFGGIHRGFSPPGSSPETQPESSTNYELGYRIQQNALFASAVLFRNNYSNLLGADLASSGGTGSGDLYNGGASRSQGLELAISYRKRISDSAYIPINMQYTLTDAQFKNNFDSNFAPWGSVSSGDELPYLSKHTFNIRSGVNTKKFGLSINTNYLGEMRTNAGQGVIDAEEQIDSRLVFNFDSAFTISKRTSLHFAVHNLTNKTYIVANRPAGWRPGAPRSFSFSLQNSF